MPNLEYPGGGSLEDVLMRKLGGGFSTEVPAINPELMTTGDVAGPTVPTAPLSLSDTIMKGLKDYGPLISQIGTTLMRPVGPGAAGKETVGSQMGNAVTGALTSMKMNEALKKMIADQLGGGGKTFNEGQPVGLSNADVAGLSPDQVSGLYGVGLKVRESELKRPMDAITTISDAYYKVMSGEAKPAEMEKHLADAAEARRKVADAPAKTLLEQLTKIQALNKADAEIKEIKAKTEAIPTETAKKAAETEKAKAEEKKIKAEVDPAFIAFKKRLETQYGPLEEIQLGDRAILTNKATGKEVASYATGAKPETTTKKMAEELPLKKFAMQRIAPLVVTHLEAEMSALPGGKQKVDLQNLISSLRGYTGEIDPGVLLAKSSPQLQDKFNKLMDIYIKTPGLSETEFGGIVQSIMGTPKPVTPVVPGKPTIIGKNVPTPTVAASTPEPPRPVMPPEEYAKQLKGKPDGIYQNTDKTISVTWQGGKVTNIEQKKVAPTNIPQYNFGTF